MPLQVVQLDHMMESQISLLELQQQCRQFFMDRGNSRVELNGVLVSTEGLVQPDITGVSHTEIRSQI